MANVPPHVSSAVTAVNAPQQRRIVYRAADWHEVRARLIAGMAALRPDWNAPNDGAGDVRGQQELGVAFIELFTHVEEILGFYQDCRANEAYLRTARLPASVLELTVLIGYSIPPGASASTLQLFLLNPGEEGTIPARFRVQAAATEDRPELTFETSREVNASAARNALRLHGFDRSARVLNAPGVAPEHSILLDDAYAGLKSGSFIVVQAPSKNAVALRITAVTDEAGRKRVHWSTTASPQPAALPVTDAVVLGKPKQAMPVAARARADELTVGSQSARVVDPGGMYPGMVVLMVSDGFEMGARIIKRGTGSEDVEIMWDRPLPITLRRSATVVRPTTTLGTSGTIARGATSVVVSGTHTLSTGAQLLIADSQGVERVTVVATDTGGWNTYISFAEPTPRAFVATGSQVTVHSLATTSTRFSPDVVAGDATVLALDATYEGLVPGATVVVSDGATTVVRTISNVVVADDRTSITLNQSIGKAMSAASLLVHGPFELMMRIDGWNRAEAMIAAGQTVLRLDGVVAGFVPGNWLVIDDGGHAEGARISSISTQDGDTLLALSAPLDNAYALADAVVYGNVAEVSHGATVDENRLGSGDHATSFQRFSLGRGPVSFTHDPGGWLGVRNSLEIIVDGERWTEVRTLADSGPNDRHYMTEVDDREVMSVVFGDGRYGARLPTGRDNLRARYRVGLGTTGNVAAGAIDAAPEPLPFMASTRNPIPASGGANRQNLEETRALAPTHVRALDRAVTLGDFADLARNHAGIGKARAVWEVQEGRRSIVLTVAANGGAQLTPTLRDSLAAFLHARGSPLFRVHVRDYRPMPIRLALDVAVLPRFLRVDTLQRLQRAFGSHGGGYFAFDSRDFGNELYLSDVYALAERVPGVDHVRATAFHAEGQPAGILDRIDIPADALPTGGSASDPSVGLLIISVTGGFA